ncbi:MAG: hypothetical protein KA807_02480 [Prolixibacteraceae bacterium]|nr:hypothetical protein [Prolixibacteraceae bacterium]
MGRAASPPFPLPLSTHCRMLVIPNEVRNLIIPDFLNVKNVKGNSEIIRLFWNELNRSIL